MTLKSIAPSLERRMHDNSMRLMREFIASHVKCATGSVLDVGSGDVNGCYRPLWHGWEYVGVDIAPGLNVDAIVPADQPWSLGRLFDVAISGQCLEHTRKPWELVKVIADHVKPGGMVCLIAPFQWGHHRYPIDCWRFAPDGMDVLFEVGGLTRVESRLSRAHRPGLWDCIGVARKPMS